MAAAPTCPAVISTSDSDGLPQQNGTMTARFTCNIPLSAVTETSPAADLRTSTTTVRPSMYGHGLFGDYTEVHTADVRSWATTTEC